MQIPDQGCRKGSFLCQGKGLCHAADLLLSMAVAGKKDGIIQSAAGIQQANSARTTVSAITARQQ